MILPVHPFRSLVVSYRFRAITLELLPKSKSLVLTYYKLRWEEKLTKSVLGEVNNLLTTNQNPVTNIVADLTEGTVVGLTNGVVSALKGFAVCSFPPSSLPRCSPPISLTYTIASSQSSRADHQATVPSLNPDCACNMVNCNSAIIDAQGQCSESTSVPMLDVQSRQG
jgi:hypothetical protein